MFSTVMSFLDNPMLRAKWGGWALRMLIILVAFVFAYFPIVWIGSASVNETGTLNTQKLIPKQFGFKNYESLLHNEIQLVRDLGDTVKACVRFEDCGDQFKEARTTYQSNNRQSLRPLGLWMWNSI